jgi:hypothetical protein
VKRIGDELRSVPITDIYEQPLVLNVGRVQDLMIALHNLRDTNGLPAHVGGAQLEGPLDLVFESLLLLMERVQPGVMGYPKE